MRGTFFVPYLKGNSGDQIMKLADSQATRTKVANAVVCVQKISDVGQNADDTPEIEELWKSASNCELDNIVYDDNN